MVMLRSNQAAEVELLMRTTLSELQANYGIVVQQTITDPIPQAPPPLQIEEEVRNLEPV
jgi:hypothetical protein